MSTAADPALGFVQVSRRFGGAAALDGVSVTIDRGSFVALVGTSGSGKSTLLRLANRLDRPDAGQVLFDGRDVAGAIRSSCDAASATSSRISDCFRT